MQTERVKLFKENHQNSAEEILLNSHTPMMAQYHRIKQEHPDCLLFFRMGEFYELFFEDAIAAAAALDITLTRRGKHESQDIPMCGVPVHASEAYLARLIRKGFRVAICEQIEDPLEAKKRSGKTLVKREVIRVVTAGTLTEDVLLDGRQHNFLAVLCIAKEERRNSNLPFSLAAVDMSTGDFFIESIPRNSLGNALVRLNPSELILSESILQKPDLFELLQERKSILRSLPDSRFDPKNGRSYLENLFSVKALDGFGAFTETDITAASALIDYIYLTQKGTLPRLEPPRRISLDNILEIDAATQKNLELVSTLSGAKKGSLLSIIDCTVTNAGGRLLLRRLVAPLAHAEHINERLDAVEFFTTHPHILQELRGFLKVCPDLERCLSRLSFGRGGPRDLAAIAQGLQQTDHFRQCLNQEFSLQLPKLLQENLHKLSFHSDLVKRLMNALGGELPLQARDGGFIAAGYLPELEEVRALRDQGKQYIVVLQTRYVEETGVNTLKIRYNNVLGYYVEVPPAQASKLSTSFIHRQGLANAQRFTTVELSELVQKLSAASEKALALELQLFEELVKDVILHASDIARIARSLAELDVSLALAALALEKNLCRPKIDASLDFNIKGGRHIVVEETMNQEQSNTFIKNDCVMLQDSRIWLITGPNMAGKSTFLRQNALIVILAQMGSFVPAESAHIGVIDRLFSRVGAADDLARGRSTFMVEMVETAAILNQATERSLVILDEVGRGTSTYDGVSIAWAAIEHLHHVNQCRSLFATHYHELTELEEQLPNLGCFTVKIKEWQGEVVFLHEVISGKANRSYGLHVAQLAGIPKGVIERAHTILKSLEGKKRHLKSEPSINELPLFAAKSQLAPTHSLVEERLVTVNPDSLSPRQAQQLLYELKDILNQDKT
jgi:DNA mismatch repair protein MutS